MRSAHTVMPNWRRGTLPALRALASRGLKIGLISNSHRCLTSFQQHFELDGLIAAAVSSSEHGYMKPHPSIFEAALTLAGVSADESVMVGDSLAHDIAGARRVGMHGVLVQRSDAPPPDVQDARWPESPLDSFILAKLESVNLTPAGPADPLQHRRRNLLMLTDAVLAEEAKAGTRRSQARAHTGWGGVPPRGASR